MVSMELAVQTMTSYAATLELAQWAEGEGLAGMAVADHYLRGDDQTYALDQLTVLAAIAAQTESLELSTLVSPITFRHPAVMLKTAVTIDEISGGRFTLGVGAGWMEAEHEKFGFDFPSVKERFDRLEEALAYLRAARRTDGSAYAGRYYQLSEGPAPEPRGDNLRLVVGGGGKKRTPELAGTYADEFNAFPSDEPIPSRIDVARAAAQVAGRDPERLFVSSAFPLIIGADEAEAEERVEAVAANRGVDPDRIRSRYRELGIPLGGLDRYLSRLEEMEAEGVQRVYLQVGFDSLAEIQQSVGLLLG